MSACGRPLLVAIDREEALLFEVRENRILTQGKSSKKLQLPIGNWKSSDITALQAPRAGPDRHVERNTRAVGFEVLQLQLSAVFLVVALAQASSGWFSLLSSGPIRRSPLTHPSQ